MTPPDTNTILLVLITALGWVGAWFHGQRNGARKAALRDWQHEQMWASYSAMKGIGNGGKHGRT